jgi:hypothetical protein
MCRAAKDGRHLANLVVDAAALCKAASERLSSRTGPGRPETFERWQIAVLIFIAILRGRKSKSSQWRYLSEHARMLLHMIGSVLKVEQMPSRATYMRRYSAAYLVFELAIELGGRKSVMHHVCDARVVVADKSMIAARGRVRPPKRIKQVWKGVDYEAGWGKSAHDGWVWGYSYEVVVSAGRSGLILPLLASVGPADTSEFRSFKPKIAHLPKSTQFVLGDGGYDGNELAEVVEYTKRGKKTGRRFLTPLRSRGGQPAVGFKKRKGRRERLRQHRVLRDRFRRSVRGRRLYKRRSSSVEPFNQWFKDRFDLQDRVWHRRLNNNRTSILAAIFIYQRLQHYNFTQGRRDGTIQWILDAL